MTAACVLADGDELRRSRLRKTRSGSTGTKDLAGRGCRGGAMRGDGPTIGSCGAAGLRKWKKTPPDEQTGGEWPRPVGRGTGRGGEGGIRTHEEVAPYASSSSESTVHERPSPSPLNLGDRANRVFSPRLSAVIRAGWGMRWGRRDAPGRCADGLRRPDTGQNTGPPGALPGGPAPARGSGRRNVAEAPGPDRPRARARCERHRLSPRRRRLGQGSELRGTCPGDNQAMKGRRDSLSGEGAGSVRPIEVFAHSAALNSEHHVALRKQDRAARLARSPPPGAADGAVPASLNATLYAATLHPLVRPQSSSCHVFSLHSYPPLPYAPRQWRDVSET